MDTYIVYCHRTDDNTRHHVPFYSLESATEYARIADDYAMFDDIRIGKVEWLSVAADDARPREG